jgi:hypothetical protein
MAQCRAPGPGRPEYDLGTTMPRTAALLACPLAGLLLTGLAGCSSRTPTSAATAGAAPVEASPSSAAGSTPGATATPRPATGGGGGGSGRTGAPPGTATPRTSPATSPPAGLPEITSFDSSTPGCTSTKGSTTVKLSWTSKNATEAWISNPVVASAAGDPKTTPGSTGPLPATGSTTMSFDCSSMYNYYDLGVYGGGHSSGEVKQVQRNV